MRKPVSDKILREGTPILRMKMRVERRGQHINAGQRLNANESRVADEE